MDQEGCHEDGESKYNLKKTLKTNKQTNKQNHEIN